MANEFFYVHTFTPMILESVVFPMIFLSVNLCPLAVACPFSSYLMCVWSVMDLTIAGFSLMSLVGVILGFCFGFDASYLVLLKGLGADFFTLVLSSPISSWSLRISVSFSWSFSLAAVVCFSSCFFSFSRTSSRLS